MSDEEGPHRTVAPRRQECAEANNRVAAALNDLVHVMQEAWLAEREQPGACYARIGNMLDEAGLLPERQK